MKYRRPLQTVWLLLVTELYARIPEARQVEVWSPLRYCLLVLAMRSHTHSRPKTSGFSNAIRQVTLLEMAAGSRADTAMLYLAQCKEIVKKCC